MFLPQCDKRLLPSPNLILGATMFRFSKLSLQRLNGVHPKLQKVAFDALAESPIDFGIAVDGGLRTLEDQRRLVASGASRTLNSKHLAQSDGFGHAIDIIPVVNGKRDPETWANFFTIATTLAAVAERSGVTLRWGGCWITINGLDKAGLEAAVRTYNAARKAAGKRPFNDLAHFELVL